MYLLIYSMIDWLILFVIFQLSEKKEFTVISTMHSCDSNLAADAHLDAE